MQSQTLRQSLAAFLRSRTANGRRRSAYTVRKYNSKLKGFLAEFGDVAAWQLDPEAVEVWFAALEPVYADATLHMVRSCLLAVLRWVSAESGVDCTGALRYVPRYDARPARVVTANEHHVRMALDLCGTLMHSAKAMQRRDAAVFVLAAASGQRRSGLVALRLSAMRDALATPLFEPTSGTYYTLRTVAKGRRTPLVFGEFPADCLRSYVQIRPKTAHDRLFVELRPNHARYGEPLGERGLSGAYLRISEMLGVPPITFQQLRRLRGTQIARQFGLEMAAHTLGHAMSSGTRVVREHYYDPDDAAAVSAALATFVALNSSSSS